MDWQKEADELVAYYDGSVIRKSLMDILRAVAQGELIPRPAPLEMTGLMERATVLLKNEYAGQRNLYSAGCRKLLELVDLIASGQLVPATDAKPEPEKVDFIESVRIDQQIDDLCERLISLGREMSRHEAEANSDLAVLRDEIAKMVKGGAA